MFVVRNCKCLLLSTLFCIHLPDPLVVAGIHVELVPQVEGGNGLGKPPLHDLAVVGGLAVELPGVGHLAEVVHQDGGVVLALVGVVVVLVRVITSQPFKRKENFKG